MTDPFDSTKAFTDQLLENQQGFWSSPANQGLAAALGVWAATGAIQAALQRAQQHQEVQEQTYAPYDPNLKPASFGQLFLQALIPTALTIAVVLVGAVVMFLGLIALTIYSQS